MNYWERHIGDYARDAGHLSMLEHGAYTLLLDRYYSTEQPIPKDQAHRICRARTRDEKLARVQGVEPFTSPHQTTRCSRMSAIQKTMTPKHAPKCKICKGTHKVKCVVKGVEQKRDCPACGGSGKGKMAQK